MTLHVGHKTLNELLSFACVEHEEVRQMIIAYILHTVFQSLETRGLLFKPLNTGVRMLSLYYWIIRKVGTEDG